MRLCALVEVLPAKLAATLEALLLNRAGNGSDGVGLQPAAPIAAFIAYKPRFPLAEAEFFREIAARGLDCARLSRDSGVDCPEEERVGAKRSGGSGGGALDTAYFFQEEFGDGDGARGSAAGGDIDSATHADIQLLRISISIGA